MFYLNLWNISKPADLNILPKLPGFKVLLNLKNIFKPLELKIFLIFQNIFKPADLNILLNLKNI